LCVPTFLVIVMLFLSCSRILKPDLGDPFGQSCDLGYPFQVLHSLEISWYKYEEVSAAYFLMRTGLTWPSGLESIKKLAWSICNCSSVKVVRTLFVFDLDPLWLGSPSFPLSILWRKEKKSRWTIDDNQTKSNVN